MKRNFIRTNGSIMPFSIYKNTRKIAFTPAQGLKDAFHLRQPKCAFTLAEVLITLGIIGIVAALTIPSLMAKHQEKVTVTKAIEGYSILQNALNLAKAENGTLDNWVTSNIETENNSKFIEIISKYIKFTSKCGFDSKCRENSPFYNNGNVYRADMVNGISIYYTLPHPCNDDRGDDPLLKGSCGWMDIDTNGNAGPNKIGYDLFEFLITKNGIVPYGISSMDKNNAQSYFKRTCSNLANDDSAGGYGCAAWVVIKGNMDYLKCPGKLDWNEWGGPETCK